MSVESCPPLAPLHSFTTCGSWRSRDRLSPASLFYSTATAVRIRLHPSDLRSLLSCVHGHMQPLYNARTKYIIYLRTRCFLPSLLPSASVPLTEIGFLIIPPGSSVCIHIYCIPSEHYTSSICTPSSHR